MKESQFIGSLLPSLPEFALIEKSIREKYGLPEVSPEDEPIDEIYLGDRIVPPEEFRQEIKQRVLENLFFLPPNYIKLYAASKRPEETQYAFVNEIAQLPDNIKREMEEVFKFVKQMINLVSLIVEPMIDAITDMLYVHLLTGETEEVPNDWISRVATVTMSGEKMVMAISSQLANPDVIVQQFRAEYKKAFGEYHPKVTKTHTSTAYYLRLRRMGKPWNYIVEEYIRLNNYPLPRDRASKKYIDIRRRYEQRLKKRMQRTEAILDVLVRDIK